VCDLFLSERLTVELRAVSGRLRTAPDGGPIATYVAAIDHVTAETDFTDEVRL